MQIGSCGSSRNSCHGMRNGKHQRSQNVSLSECHGKVVMDGFMECNTYGTSWKGVTEINICLASWKRCHGKRHGNSEVHSVMERRHGKRYQWSVMEKPSCVMETVRCVASWKGVTEINICLVSRKKCHGKRHGNSEVHSVMERRHGKRYQWSVMEKPSWNLSWKPRGV